MKQFKLDSREGAKVHNYAFYKKCKSAVFGARQQNNLQNWQAGTNIK